MNICAKCIQQAEEREYLDYLKQNEMVRSYFHQLGFKKMVVVVCNKSLLVN